MGQSEIRMVMAGDANILWGMAVSGRTALENASRPIRIFVLAVDLDERHKARLLRSWDHPNFAGAHFEPVGRDAVKTFRSTSYLKSKATYSRYYLGNLPVEGRIVYCDTDMLILRDLGQAMDVDLGGRTLGAVTDISARVEPENPELRERLGLKDERRYFNAGFLVIDVDRWRGLGAQEKLIRLSEERFDDLHSQDQDALNILFEDDRLEMGVEWNSSQYELKADATDRVVHLIGTKKPWHADYRDHFRDPFFAALDRTDFKGARPARGRLATILKLIERKLPTADMVLGKVRRAISRNG